MRGISLLVTLQVGLAGCAQLIGLEDVPTRHSIGGQVRGLWDGTSGVKLSLEVDGVSHSVTVPGNGVFRFEEEFSSGTNYQVSMTLSAAQHTCTVDAGGTGEVTEADVTSISIACKGPDVTIDLSGAQGWTFDPTADVQSFDGSVVAQEVRLTITGSELASAMVAGAAVKLGEQTAPFPLQLGDSMIKVALNTSGGLSRTYELTFHRGTSMLEQMAYGKASNTEAKDAFGTSVSLSGDTLAVGVPFEDSAAIGVNGNRVGTAMDAGAVYVFVRTGTTWTQQAYLKASNTGMNDEFGHSVSLSGDTLAVGAPLAAGDAGVVYVFVRTGTTWTQQECVKASNTEAGDEFGWSVSLSGDTLAVGALDEDSATTGVNGSPDNEAAGDAGAVYVFVRTGTKWTQQAYVKASNTESNDAFGTSVSLSGDTLAVGAPGEDSATTGVNGNATNNFADGAGAVYVFVRTSTTWIQQAYLKASNTEAKDAFGTSVSLSGDTLAVGAPFEASAATGVNGNQADNSAGGAGAVYVFARKGTTWTQQAYLKALNTKGAAAFGASVSLSGDTLAVGALGEASAAARVDGNQTGTAADAGAVYVFQGTASWEQKFCLKASNAEANDEFGSAVALSGDTLAVGAVGEASAATGFNGNQADDSASQAGAVYVFH